MPKLTAQEAKIHFRMERDECNQLFKRGITWNYLEREGWKRLDSGR